jgi:hypothetical protein
MERSVIKKKRFRRGSVLPNPPSIGGWFFAPLRG